MDFAKFRDLFANEELYFRRTDLFKVRIPGQGERDSGLKVNGFPG